MAAPGGADLDWRPMHACAVQIVLNETQETQQLRWLGRAMHGGNPRRRQRRRTSLRAGCWWPQGSTLGIAVDCGTLRCYATQWHPAGIAEHHRHRTVQMPSSRGSADQPSATSLNPPLPLHHQKCCLDQNCPLERSQHTVAIESAAQQSCRPALGNAPHEGPLGGYTSASQPRAPQSRPPLPSLCRRSGLAGPPQAPPAAQRRRHYGAAAPGYRHPHPAARTSRRRPSQPAAACHLRLGSRHTAPALPAATERLRYRRHPHQHDPVLDPQRRPCHHAARLSPTLISESPRHLPCGVRAALLTPACVWKHHLALLRHPAPPGAPSRPIADSTPRLIDHHHHPRLAMHLSTYLSRPSWQPETPRRRHAQLAARRSDRCSLCHTHVVHVQAYAVP